MSKQTEALKLALPDRRTVTAAGDPEDYINSGWNDCLDAIKESLADSALERMAENARELELNYEPAQCKHEKIVDEGFGASYTFCKHCNKEWTDAMEQTTQQEPEVWRNAALRVGEDLCSVGPFGYYDMTAEQWLDWALSVVTVHAPPASKTWVGLTDAEANEIVGAYAYSYDVARATEAAHGIKGDA